jgi:CubicO group peptidase (beta-lactamase class C family)
MAKIKIAETKIYGSVGCGFEEVKTEFERNFAERGELGAACAIYYRGEKVVDLWGGYRDEATLAPWEEDTIVPVWSTTKGFSALTLAVAHS